MTPGKWLICAMLLLAHVALVVAVVIWPYKPPQVAPLDYIADERPVSELPVSDYTKFESDMCAVHRVRMEPTIVPVVYGLQIDDPRFAIYSVESTREVRAQLFPNDRSSVRGGCVVGAARRARIFVCPECERAREQWMRAGREELDRLKE